MRRDPDVDRLIYDAFAEAYVKRFADEPPDRVHVTECVDCLRKWYLYRNGVELEPDKTVILTMGQLVHREVLEALAGRGYDVEVELTWRVNDVTVVGHADALNGCEVLELKTVSRIPFQPWKHHLLQANAYAFMADVPEFVIAYVSKSSGRVRSYRYRRDEKAWSYILGRAVELSHYLRRREMPPAEPGTLCKWCSVRGKCGGWRQLAL